MLSQDDDFRIPRPIIGVEAEDIIAVVHGLDGGADLGHRADAEGLAGGANNSAGELAEGIGSQEDSLLMSDPVNRIIHDSRPPIAENLHRRRGNAQNFPKTNRHRNRISSPRRLNTTTERLHRQSRRVDG